MYDLPTLLIFARVAEMASFTRAAESLGIQKGRASGTVRGLEAEVGARLLHRTTRRVQLTEDGKAFYDRVQSLLAEAEDLRAMFAERDAPLRGRLRVDLPTELARTTIVPALPSFMTAHPALQLKLSSTDRRVDLVREGVDCALRIGPIGDESLVAHHLGSMRMINAASPAYLDRHGVPGSLDDLTARGHRVVHYRPTPAARPFGWEYPDGDGHAALLLPGALSVDSVQAYHAAGLSGLGLIQARFASLSPYLDRGELVEILPESPPAPLSAYVVLAHRHNLSRRVRVFMDWLAEVLAPSLDG